jgi:RHS repeat-associated protein
MDDYQEFSSEGVSYFYDGISRSTDFDGNDIPASFQISGTVTVTNSVLQITGHDQWYDGARLVEADITDGEGVRFSFKTDSAGNTGAMVVDVDDWGEATFRRWSIMYYSGEIYLEAWKVSSNVTKQTLMDLSANTWYEVILGIDGTNAFRALIWERDDPTEWAEYSQFMPNSETDWAGRPWKFITGAYTNTLELDNYMEIDIGAAGLRTTMTDGSGSRGDDFDFRSRLWRNTTTVAQVGSFETQWGGFNAANQPGWMVYPGGNASEAGEKVEFDYNLSGALDGVDGNDTYVSDMQYDEAGRLTEIVRGSSLTSTYGYYDWDETVGGVGQGGRLETMTTGSLQDLSYTYDAGGNILNIVDIISGTTDTITATYDALNRLTSAEGAGFPGIGFDESYSYDSQGRLTGLPDLGTYGYNDSDYAHAVTHIGAAQKYWYDENGSMITRTMGTETFQFDYDALNRLTEVEEDDLEANFFYNGDGARMLGIISATNVITTVYIGSYYEYVISDTQTITKSYYYAGSTRVAMRDNGTLYFLLSDHLGSTSLTIGDDESTVIAELRYKPWGSIRYSNGSTPTDYTFNGHRSVSYIKLILMGSRYYDSTLGRFTQPDTIVPVGVQGIQAFDRFAFVNNNPLRYVDPTGHYGETPTIDGICSLETCFDNPDLLTEPGSDDPPFDDTLGGNIDDEGTEDDGDNTDKCDMVEFVAGWAIIVVVDVSIGVVIVAEVLAYVPPPILVEHMEIIDKVLLPANLLAAVLIVDSNCFPELTDAIYDMFD